MKRLKNALVVNADRKAAVIKNLKAEKDSLRIVLSEQDRESAPDEKRIKGADSNLGLDVRCVGVDSKVLKKRSVCCGCETAELCHFDAVARRASRFAVVRVYPAMKW